jgi:hypothetical protein
MAHEKQSALQHFITFKRNNLFGGKPERQIFLSGIEKERYLSSPRHNRLACIQFSKYATCTPQINSCPIVGSSK